MSKLIKFCIETPFERVHYFETTRITEKLTHIPEEGGRREVHILNIIKYT